MTPEQQQLVADNLVLVQQVAKSYEGRGVTLLDMMQSGNLGLIKAAEKWQGVAEFGPFARFHIRQAIVKLFPKGE